jgi:hypothetical protein
MGIDDALMAKLKRLPAKHGRRLIEKERRVENAVGELIDRSLSNYYFEQIGNALVEIRRLSPESLLRGGFEEKLTELVEAYNLHTEKEVSVDEVVPAELREYMK